MSQALRGLPLSAHQRAVLRQGLEKLEAEAAETRRILGGARGSLAALESELREMRAALERPEPEPRPPVLSKGFRWIVTSSGKTVHVRAGSREGSLCGIVRGGIVLRESPEDVHICQTCLRQLEAVAR